jgi:hypothetical protein
LERKEINLEKETEKIGIEGIVLYECDIDGSELPPHKCGR